MTPKRLPKAPRHLRPKTRQWWTSVMETYEMEPHHEKTLTLAAEALDRAIAAREAIDTYGITYVDRHGTPKARPEVAIERDSKIVYSRLLRELRLDHAAPESRPPDLAER